MQKGLFASARRRAFDSSTERSADFPVCSRAPLAAGVCGEALARPGRGTGRTPQASSTHKSASPGTGARSSGGTIIRAHDPAMAADRCSRAAADRRQAQAGMRSATRHPAARPPAGGRALVCNPECLFKAPAWVRRRQLRLRAQGAQRRSPLPVFLPAGGRRALKNRVKVRARSALDDHRGGGRAANGASGRFAQSAGR